MFSPLYPTCIETCSNLVAGAAGKGRHVVQKVSKKNFMLSHCQPDGTLLASVERLELDAGRFS